MTDVVPIDARWVVQVVLCSALLTTLAAVSFRSNAVTRRAYALVAGLLLILLPFVLALTSAWHWTAPFEVLTTVSLAWSLSIPYWLVAAWVGVALGLNALALAHLIRTRRELARLPRVDDPGILGEAQKVAAQLAFRQPYSLHLGPTSCSSALAGNRIVLQSDARDWQPRALRAVLAHEFVHLQRRDDLCLFALRLVLHWYWFAPWVALLRQHFATAMEQSCDDRAAECLPSSADYLDGVLCAARAQQTPPVVAAFGSAVVERFQRFLGSRERQLDVGGVYWALVAVVGTALLLTSVEFEAREANRGSWAADSAGLPTVTALRPLVLPEVQEQAVIGERDTHRDFQPIYPGAALRDAIDGSVVVMYRISRDGRVVRPEVVSSEPEGVFDDAVLRAVSQREYIPAHDLVDAGQPVADRLVRRFDFRHPDGQADQTFEIRLR